MRKPPEPTRPAHEQVVKELRHALADLKQKLAARDAVIRELQAQLARPR